MGLVAAAISIAISNIQPATAATDVPADSAKAPPPAPGATEGGAATQELPTIPVVPMSRDEPVEPATQQSTVVMEQVVVTAQKRAESINEVPLSIQAFSG